jgi:putative endonuclease
MRTTGDVFEDRALAHLERAGLVLVERNFRNRFGEIDLVMREGDTLVFVEVRYRRSRAFGGAADSVTARKRERLERAARGFLAAHPEHAGRACRFDLMAFDGQPARAQLDWQRAAFDAEG